MSEVYRYERAGTVVNTTGACKCTTAVAEGMWLSSTHNFEASEGMGVHEIEEGRSLSFGM